MHQNYQSQNRSISLISGRVHFQFKDTVLWNRSKMRNIMISFFVSSQIFASPTNIRHLSKLYALPVPF